MENNTQALKNKKSNKGWIISISVLILLAILIGVFLLTRKKTDEGIKTYELAQIITEHFGATVKGDGKILTKVQSSDEGYDFMLTAEKMGLFYAVEPNIQSNESLSNELAYYMLARAFMVRQENGTVSGVNSKYQPEIAGLIKEGVLSESTLKPSDLAKKEEMTTLLNNLSGEVISEPGTKTSVSGKNIFIKSKDVILKGLTVEGNVVVADAVGIGEVTFDNLTVKGKVLISGSGTNSVYIKNKYSANGKTIIRNNLSVTHLKLDDSADLGDIDAYTDFILDGKGGNLNLKDNVKGTISGSIQNVSLDDNAQLVLKTGSEFKNITANGPSPVITIENGVKGDKIELTKEASDPTVSISGEVGTVSSQTKVTLTVTGKVGTIELSETASNSTIAIEEGATVSQMTVSAEGTTISGSGQVQNITVNASNVKITLVGAYVTAGPGVTGVFAGDKEVPPGTTVRVEAPKEEPKPEPTTPAITSMVLYLKDGRTVTAKLVNGVYVFDASSYGDTVVCTGVKINTNVNTTFKAIGSAEKINTNATIPMLTLFRLVDSSKDQISSRGEIAIKRIKELFVRYRTEEPFRIVARAFGLTVENPANTVTLDGVLNGTTSVKIKMILS